MLASDLRLVEAETTTQRRSRRGTRGQRIRAITPVRSYAGSPARPTVTRADVPSEFADISMPSLVTRNGPSLARNSPQRTAHTGAFRRARHEAGSGVRDLDSTLVTLFRSLGQTRGTSGLKRGWAAVHEEKRQTNRSTVLGVGTFACCRCDAPVAIGDRPRLLTDQLSCPFCHRRGPARDFLSLARPTRPARVYVRVTIP